MSEPPAIRIELSVPPGTGRIRVKVKVKRERSAAETQHELMEPASHPAEPRSFAGRPSAAVNAITFRQAAQAYIDGKRTSWKSEKHAEQWSATLESFVHPLIGDRAVADIDIKAVLEVLEAEVPASDGRPAGPFWTARSETAKRVRGRIERILDWAKVRGYRSGENPAAWRGNLQMALPDKGARVKHHAALPYAIIARFMAELRTRNGASARALEFCVLTAARTGEVLGARWSEIDLAAKVWTIPGERMKAGAEHRVPLTGRCVEILEAIPRQGDLVFPGPRGQLSNMALLSVLSRMNRDGITVHGFRSTFRDWAAETTSHPREVVEMALAHTIGSKVEAAYRRGDLFEKRRRLMDDWGAACGSLSAKPALPQAAE